VGKKGAIMANRNDVTAPTDTVRKMASKRNKNDSQALYGDDPAPDANARAGVNDNPNLPKKSKMPKAPPTIEDKSSGRIGKDPTESF
jgi:hypothetical protein